MNCIFVVSLLLAVANTEPVFRHTAVYKTSSIYPNYVYQHQPFAQSPYPNPLFQPTYDQHPAAFNYSTKALFEPDSRTANDVNNVPRKIEQQSLASPLASAAAGGENLKIKLIGETDHGTINLVNPFIAHKPPGVGKKEGDDGVVINSSETDVHVPFFHAHLDPIFGPEIAPKYEIHYLPHNFNYADFADHLHSFQSSPSLIPNVQLDHHPFITSNVNAPQPSLFPAIDREQSPLQPGKNSDAIVKPGNGQSGTDHHSAPSVPQSGSYQPSFAAPQSGNESPSFSPTPQSDSTETTTQYGKELTSSQFSSPELRLGVDSKNEDTNAEPGVVGAPPSVDSSKPATELFSGPASDPSNLVQKNGKRSTVVKKA